MPNLVRTTAAFVTRRNGAWLINVIDQTHDREEDQCYDAASSRPAARRVAVEIAKAFGYSGAVRWTPGAAQEVLEMTWDNDYSVYPDHDE